MQYVIILYVVCYGSKEVNLETSFSAFFLLYIHCGGNF